MSQIHTHTLHPLFMVKNKKKQKKRPEDENSNSEAFTLVINCFASPDFHLNVLHNQRPEVEDNRQIISSICILYLFTQAFYFLSLHGDTRAHN